MLVVHECGHRSGLINLFPFIHHLQMAQAVSLGILEPVVPVHSRWWGSFFYFFNCYLRLVRTRLKVHCYAIQCFYVHFCGRKARRLEAAAPANESQALAILFFSSPVRSFAIDRRRSTSQLSTCPCKVILLSDEVGFEIWSRKWKQLKKTSLPWTMVKIRGVQNWLVELHGSILSCIGLTIVQDLRSFRCSCVYFAAQYNVHCDNRQAGNLLSTLRLERCMAAIIFPHNKMAQNITE